MTNKNSGSTLTALELTIINRRLDKTIHSLVNKLERTEIKKIEKQINNL